MEINKTTIKHTPLILIVDDIPKNLQLLSSILNSEGFQIAFASSGVQALSVVGITKPDLILLDIMMPDMDGFEVCRRIKSNESLVDIPIIFLTGRIEPEDLAQGFQLGAVDYILKPFNTTELLSRVRTHIELKFARDRLRDYNNQLTEYQNELQQTIAAKDKFFSIISHDLRGPFSGFIGLSELLRVDIETMDRDEIVQIATSMNNGAKRLFNLLENLLEWANAQLGRIHYKPTKLDFHVVVEKIIQLNSNTAGEKKIKLSNLIQPDTNVIADYNMINTVVRNLLSNALKFTPSGGEIKIDSQDVNGSYEILVKDTGVGMDEATISKLFRIDTKISNPGTNNESGSGLGLLLCNELLLAHSTKLSVESELEVGTTFSFELKKG